MLTIISSPVIDYDRYIVLLKHHSVKNILIYLIIFKIDIISPRSMLTEDMGHCSPSKNDSTTSAVSFSERRDTVSECQICTPNEYMMQRICTYTAHALALPYDKVVVERVPLC